MAWRNGGIGSAMRNPLKTPDLSGGFQNIFFAA
jgi:hypothetical protein